MRPGYMRRFLLLLAALACIALIATRPRVANHFGYALPISNGLPCRLHYHEREYENDAQCGGMNQSGWSAWYAARHHLLSGGLCQTPAALRQTHDWPLQQVTSIWTLLGPAHPVFASRRNDGARSFTTMVLYVQDAACYRPYVLLGGP